MSSLAIVAAVAYLLGSIPFGYLLVKAVRGQDIRATGSGNIGATNVARAGAPGLGAATLLLDAAKGAAAVLFALWLQPHEQVAQAYLVGSVAAVFAIAGHIFPIWLLFRGGKGVATAIGSFLVLAPAALGLTLAVFVLVAAAFRYVSLASIISVGLFPLFFALLYRAPAEALAVVVVGAAVIIASHHQNIRRLRAGTEPRFTLGRTT
jgi:acyl phosphate:glycerol-3-phosphate acyltransferase